MINTSLSRFYNSFRLFLQSKKGKATSTAIAVVFTILILGRMLYQEREVLFTYQWNINWSMAVISFFIYSCALFLASLVWIWIMKAMGVDMCFGYHFRHYCISQLAKRLPGTIWYVAYRSQMYQKEGLSAKLISLASGIELAIVVISGIILSVLFAAPLMQQYRASVWGILLLLFLSLIFLHPRVLGWMLKKFNSSLDRFEYRQILSWIFAYIVVRLFSGGLIFFIANIIYPVTIDHLGYIIGGWAFIGVLSNILLFSPTNLGFTEVSLSLILSIIMPSSIAVLVAVLSRVTITAFEFFWAIIALAVDRIAGKPV